MALRYGNREQMNLLPESIEDYIPKDAPVRAYDAMINSINLRELGIIENNHKVGCPEYDPSAMLKLLVYGYSYGHRSSRKLERELHYNLSFIWLMGGLKPDHKTIAEFRRKNKPAIKNLLKQTAQICIKLNLIEGNVLFLDGTKIKATASIKALWTRERAQQKMAKLDEKINKLLNDCESIDSDERNLESIAKMQEELTNTTVLKNKISAILEEIKQSTTDKINTTDRESMGIKTAKGYYAGYNAQAVTDKQNGLIVHTDVVAETNDLNQFSKQIKEANKVVNGKCTEACADTGYANTNNLSEIDKDGIKVIVPSIRQVQKEGPFGKAAFSYDEKKDLYICPEGFELHFRKYNKQAEHLVYQIKKNSTCTECKNFGVCTKSKNGRSIVRLKNEELREKFEKQYLDSKDTYRLRKQKVELQFGHLKRNLKFDSLLLKGLEGAKTEISILATCFNMVRMIGLLGGVTCFIEKVGGI